MSQPPADTLHIADSLTADSLSSDSDSVACREFALVIERDQSGHTSPLRRDNTVLSSWIFIGLVALFLFFCFKFRKNFKYIKILIREMFSARERGNMFDDTVRETTFISLLNLGTVCCIGILLYYLPCLLDGASVPENPRALGICMACAVGYQAFMFFSYWLWGHVLFDSGTATAWLRGYTASQCVFAIALFIPSVLILFYSAAIPLIIVELTIFGLIKLTFIIRGLRIFLTQNVSWLIFLCYLCAIEIVPVIMACFCAANLCNFY